jgi:hypothetical protein
MGRGRGEGRSLEFEKFGNIENYLFLILMDQEIGDEDR